MPLESSSTHTITTRANLGKLRFAHRASDRWLAPRTALMVVAGQALPPVDAGAVYVRAGEGNYRIRGPDEMTDGLGEHEFFIIGALTAVSNALSLSVSGCSVHPAQLLAHAHAMLCSL